MNKKRKIAEKIDLFFEKENFTSQDVKKIRKVAMSANLKIGDRRKKFCKKCFSALSGKVSFKEGFLGTKCRSCGFLNRWRVIPKKKD